MIDQKLIDFLEKSPYAANYGTEITATAPHTECVTPWQEIFAGNPLLRSWHGGIVSGVLELTATLAALNSINGNEISVISINTSYLRPTRGDLSLFSQATAARTGKQVHTVNAIAWQGSHSEPTAIASVVLVGK